MQRVTIDPKMFQNEIGSTYQFLKLNVELLSFRIIMHMFYANAFLTSQCHELNLNSGEQSFPKPYINNKTLTVCVHISGFSYIIFARS